MLGRLLKYEFKATGRLLLPLYGAMVLLGLITSFFHNADSFHAPQLVSTMIYIGICIASVVVTLLLVIQRFQKNLLSDEGYLMFTLPVSVSNLIFSKLIVAVCWGIIGIVAGILSGVALGSTIIPWGDVPEMTRMLFHVLGKLDFLDWISFSEAFISSIFSYAIFVMAIYFSLSVGQLPFAGIHRNAASLVVFFLLYTIYITLISVANMFNPWIVNLPYVAQMGIALGIQAAVILVLFFLTRFILDKHLNLA